MEINQNPMKQFSSVLFGATFAATTAAVVAFTPSSAQAITLSGSLTINGNAVVLPGPGAGQLTIDFQDVDNITSVPLFSNFNPPLDPGTQNAVLPYDPNGGTILPTDAIIDIQDLVLSARVPTVDNVSNYETTSVVTSFLNFGQRTLGAETGSLTFDLNPATFIGAVNSSGGQVLTLHSATGVWKFNGSTISTASISATSFGDNGSYTISATAIPEPLTMGGLAIGAGFAGFLKTRYSKKGEQLKKA